MLDLDHLRAEFGRLFTSEKNDDLDRALARVCRLAYHAGREDGRSAPWATDVHGRKLYPLDVPTVEGEE